ncbi:MAG: homoserine dehydrogenase [Actinomycetota bacterium]|nr:homoserine dehydrogenase [Actinomycetota bacterium]
MKTLKVGMLGAGVVGSQIARLLIANKSDLASRAGANLELVSIAVKDSKLKRDGISAALLTSDAKSIVNDPQIDLVIEVIGGIDPAKELILTALKNGKSVVTANKALLAKHGAELYAAADKANVDLYYEAAVAGAIPILRPLRESLVGDHVIRVMGIVNGTTNYILTKMDENGIAFADALKEAQALGFAESDPSADIEGFDAAAKAAILAGLAFHSRVTDNDVYREGISKITAADVKVAKAMEMVIKLLAIAELTPEGAVSVRVHPALISRTHPLASVRGSFNAVFVEAKSAGQMMFYGKGAGGEPTASAILGDLVAVARHKVTGGIGPKESDYADLKIAQIGQTKTRYLIRLNVADKPGVLESVAHVFASHQVSIQTVRQTGAGDKAELIVMTHSSNESSLSATVKDLKNLPAVTDVASVLRVEGVN